MICQVQNLAGLDYKGSFFLRENRKLPAMRKLLCLLVALFLCAPMFSQIVNIESLRINAKDRKLSGIVDLNFAIRKNKAGETVIVGADVGAQWNLNEKNELIFLSSYGLTQFNATEDPGAPTRIFNNQAFAHLGTYRIYINGQCDSR
jgi:hypothetical protein